MIWRLLATRCRISSSSNSFSRSSSSFSRSAARLWVTSSIASNNAESGLASSKTWRALSSKRATTHRGKLMLDFVSLDRATLGNDLFQKPSKRGDIPLALGQLVEQAALSLGRLCPERLVERAACREHAEIAIEHDQGLANRVHDGVGQRARLLDVARERSDRSSQAFSRNCKTLANFSDISRSAGRLLLLRNCLQWSLLEISGSI